MSRLESFIRRMQAQRDCINLAAGMIEDVPGVVWEFGLGNGRSYDHLRETFPDREVFVFDLKPYAPMEFRPPEDRLIVGDVLQTVPAAAAASAGKVALLHYDVGTGHRDDDVALAHTLSNAIAPALAPNAIAMGVYELSIPGTSALETPEHIGPGRYFIYRRDGV